MRNGLPTFSADSMRRQEQCRWRRWPQLWLSVLVALLMVAGAGCDRPKTNDAPPAPAAPPPDPYQQYSLVISPLVDELIRMRILFGTGDGDDPKLFAEQYRKISFEFLKARPLILEESKKLDSWAYLLTAMQGLQGIQAGNDAVVAINERSKVPGPTLTPMEQLDHLDQLNRRTKQAMDDFNNGLTLHHDIPILRAKVAEEIDKLRQAIQEKR